PNDQGDPQLALLRRAEARQAVPPRPDRRLALDDLVAIARIARPRGIRGEVIAEVITDFPERFEGLEAVAAVQPNGERLELTIQNAWFQNERIVLKFEGIDSIEAAEKLRDASICVPESEVVELEE